MHDHGSTIREKIKQKTAVAADAAVAAAAYVVVAALLQVKSTD